MRGKRESYQWVKRDGREDQGRALGGSGGREAQQVLTGTGGYGLRTSLSFLGLSNDQPR